MLKKIMLMTGELVLMTAAAFVSAWMFLENKTAYRLLYWAALPLFGMLEAYFATNKGINNYISWIFPPLGMALGHILLWSKPPESPGMCLLCALTAVVGAAAGEVKQRTEVDKACQKIKRK